MPRRLIKKKRIVQLINGKPGENRMLIILTCTMLVVYLSKT